MRIHLILAVVVVSILLSGGVVGETPAPGRPNVLFLICDDLNCDLGCYGHPLVQSPNIDRLAQRGTRFEHAYCQYPLCGPSRASFMTGLYPDQTRIHRNAIYVRQHLPDVTTLSQRFRSDNYFAMRIGKIYHYGVPRHIGTSGHDDPDSWDHTINPRGRDKDEEDLIQTLLPGKFGGTLSWLVADGRDVEQTDGIAAKHAVRLLRNYAETSQQFFLAVGLYRPHTPYVAPRKYFEMYPLDDIEVPRIPDGYLRSLPQPARHSITRKREQVDLADELARQAIQAYYASITFADAQIGRVLNVLEETGLANNTIVLFTSDHGYHMGEHGHWQKTTLFENAARVPLIIVKPGARAAGESTDALAEMVDFYPTLAELCGILPPAYLQGVSLAGVLDDSNVQPRSSALTQYNNGYSLRTAHFRYTEWGEAGEAGIELYDHQHDPQEMVNLATRLEYAKTASELSQELQARVAAARRPLAGLRRP